MTLQDDADRGFIAVIVALRDTAGPDGLTLREILDRLDERSFGLLILILCVPCLVPALYGVPQVVGLVILTLAGQMLMGRQEPWLPDGVLNRRVPRDWLERMADFARKRMGWFERVSRPRLKVLAEGAVERVIAAFMILATLTIVLPFTNTIPSVALALMAVGLIQRDGMFTSAGAAVAVGWAGFLIALAAGFLLGAGWAVGLVQSLGG